MPELIVIGGAPGCGKSTLAMQLRSILRGPWIDFGRLREFHLERDWSNQSAEEEAMTFENLQRIIRNYVAHGYRNIIVEDLQDHRIQQVPRVLHDVSFQVLTLVVTEPSELRRRIIVRDDGWKNADAAVAWNQRVLERACADGEQKIDVTNKPPSVVVAEALQVLETARPTTAVADKLSP